MTRPYPLESSPGFVDMTGKVVEGWRVVERRANVAGSAHWLVEHECIDPPPLPKFCTCEEFGQAVAVPCASACPTVAAEARERQRRVMPAIQLRYKAPKYCSRCRPAHKTPPPHAGHGFVDMTDQLVGGWFVLGRAANKRGGNACWLVQHVCRESQQWTRGEWREPELFEGKRLIRWLAYEPARVMGLEVQGAGLLTSLRFANIERLPIGVQCALTTGVALSLTPRVWLPGEYLQATVSAGIQRLRPLLDASGFALIEGIKLRGNPPKFCDRCRPPDVRRGGWSARHKKSAPSTGEKPPHG